MSTVYVLGAGFSADLGFPLTDNLMKEIMQLAGDNEKSSVDRSLQLIYPYFNPQFKNYPNIEDILSYYQTRHEWSVVGLDPDKGITHSHTERHIKRLIALFFLKKSLDVQENEDMANYTKFFEKDVQPGDTIITFNYDYVVDLNLAIKSAQTKIIYSGSSNEKISVLKLHGSAGWLPSGLTYNNMPMTLGQPLWQDVPAHEEVHALDPKIFGRTLEENINIESMLRFLQQTQKFESLIIPPTGLKSINHGFLKNIWSDALVSVRSAERLVVIGYSLPAADLAARILLREGINTNPNRQNVDFLTVYDPDLSVKTTYEKFLLKQIQFHCTSFANSPFGFN